MRDEFELEDPIMAFDTDEDEEVGLGDEDTEDTDDLEDEDLVGVTDDEEEEEL
jgi:hypothetical protein